MKWIITNECVFGKYIHTLDFPLNIQIAKIEQFHISQIWSATESISPFVVLALSGSETITLNSECKIAKENYTTMCVYS